MHRVGIAGLVVAAAFAVAGVAHTAPSKNDDELLKDETHFLGQMNKTFSGGTKAARMRNMEVVGHADLGGRGFNADVWVHGGFAYVGHWGFTDWASGSKTRFCPEPPNNGVAVVDARDPTNPVMVSRLENPNGTWPRTSSSSRLASARSQGTTSPPRGSKCAAARGWTRASRAGSCSGT
jgi:hypothetical protein